MHTLVHISLWTCGWEFRASIHLEVKSVGRGVPAISCCLTTIPQLKGLKQPFGFLSHNFEGWLGSAGVSCCWVLMLLQVNGGKAWSHPKASSLSRLAPGLDSCISWGQTAFLSPCSLCLGPAWISSQFHFPDFLHGS